jgi:hypothetical protein
VGILEEVREVLTRSGGWEGGICTIASERSVEDARWLATEGSFKVKVGWEAEFELLWLDW